MSDLSPARCDEIGLYADEVLRHYFPPSMAVIANIAAAMKVHRFIQATRAVANGLLARYKGCFLNASAAVVDKVAGLHGTAEGNSGLEGDKSQSAERTFFR